LHTNSETDVLGSFLTSKNTANIVILVVGRVVARDLVAIMAYAGSFTPFSIIITTSLAWDYFLSNRTRTFAAHPAIDNGSLRMENAGSLYECNADHLSLIKIYLTVIIPNFDRVQSDSINGWIYPPAGNGFCLE